MTNQQLYVIYNINTYRCYTKSDGRDYFEGERAVRSMFTKLTNSGKIDPQQWQIATTQEYRQQEPMVETYNLMDPEKKPIKIRLTLKGTHMDPATERYHSM